MSQSTPQENSREEEIFQVACEIASDHAQRAYLEQVCGDDDELKQRMLTLLNADRQQPDLGETVDHSVSSPIATSKTIGPYKILQEIGKGGMGVVYMAEQTEPVKRRVALKIVKPGLDTDQVVARFEAERQALAMMDHPNIAKVLDAGATDDGRPYFVMELVKGVPITQYCDENRLSTRQRLDLFVSVCRGVQHAHLKGIIHRDLKPSNVLVAEFDHQPVAKIIDFGVAKATNQELTEKTMFTQFGQIIGTLDYMSPEQAKFNQLDIDTRSDVYSLGVLLYELLTGETPIEKQRLKETGLEEVLRIIREDEPPRPSTRVGSSATLPNLAEKRNTDPARLAGQLREDLDWIVIKAMSKDRNDRYQSAELLSADIDRHLEDLPIEARRPSITGRLRRLMRRHRTAVTMSALLMLATVIAGAFGIAAYLSRVERDRKEAELLASRSETNQARAETSQARAEAERRQWAHRSIPKVNELINEQRSVAAFRLAKQIREIIPDEPTLDDLWERVAVTVSMDKNKPVGATIQYRGAYDTEGEWMTAGQIPLENVTLPRGPLRFRVSMEGYVSHEFQRRIPHFIQSSRALITKKRANVAENMARIHGIKAAKWNDLPVDLNGFLADRYEVTNAEFQKFVDGGGYANSKYWEDIEFVRDGELISWDEAMRSFVDASGSHGPSTWHDGSYPIGQQDHPVGGVSWFEAIAYANFAEKSLPTVHHWKWVAHSDQPEILTALSNFSSEGPQPVGTNRGIGRFDVYDLGGNVKEWCFNEDEQGRRCLRGGAWNDLDYQFFSLDFASPWDRDPTFGFRCVIYEKSPPSETLARVESPAAEPIPPRDAQPIEPFLNRFDYDDLPLEPVLIQPDAPDRASSLYRHEIVEIAAAYNNERFKLHLFVPRQQKKRFDVVVVMPHRGIFENRLGEFSKAMDQINFIGHIESFTTAGKIVCLPEYNGTFERWKGHGLISNFGENPHQALHEWILVTKDLRRVVDYLLTRSEIDSDRLIYLGLSMGAMAGPVNLAVEPRLCAGILFSGGYHWEWERMGLAEVANVSFAPHVGQPVLMVNGYRDNIFSPKRHQMPLYEDLGSTVKDRLVLTCGHSIPSSMIAKHVIPWLDKVFAESGEN